MNAPIFLEADLVEIMEELQSSLEKKVNRSILKDDFSSRADWSIFISIAPMLLDWSNETSWVFPTLKQQATSCPNPQCLIDQIQVQKPILVVGTNQMPNHT